MNYEPVIGLEVHIQLNTRTKIFCGCSAKFGGPPNSQVCPVCLGLPGVLPVLNEEVLKKAVMAGLALDCGIARYSKFDRKNYFYPDLPKAYQISQFDKPICEGGHIDVRTKEGTRRIGITRIHLEEDAGKLVHSENPDRTDSFVDYNRTGVPLIEIVSEPDIRASDEAYGYLQQLKSTMKYLDVSDCNMEEGSLRCDVNISLRKSEADKFGEKVEIKNLNSFRHVKMAIDFEMNRQARILDDGGTIAQETRLWDSQRNETFSMRSKEEAHDYRYFPEPDLPPIMLDDAYIAARRDELPELPGMKKARFITDYSLSAQDAEVLTSVRQLADYYERTVAGGAQPKRASNWIQSELLARLGDPETIDSFSVTADKLAALLALIENNTISGKIAKTVFDDMVNTGRDAELIIRENGLRQVTDTSEIEKIVDAVISGNPESVGDFKSGKEKALKFLVGQIMKESRGKANPQMVNEILLKKLS
jgi:aspartyl-tRNA(Asn)/glutamyl-tRNA(Gln) amidotransferase subunit B